MIEFLWRLLDGVVRHWEVLASTVVGAGLAIWAGIPGWRHWRMSQRQSLALPAGPPVLELRAATINREDGAIDYTLINTGGSSATILAHGAHGDWHSDMRPRAVAVDYTPIENTPPGTVMEPGVPHRCHLRLTGELMAFFKITRQRSLMSTSAYYLMVRVIFADHAVARRQVDFCREYDPATKNFSMNRDTEQ